MGTLLCSTPLERLGPVSQPKDAVLPAFHKVLEGNWRSLNQASDPEGGAEEGVSPFQMELLGLMGTYRDVYYPESSPLGTSQQVRSAYCLHALNHVLKANSRVLAHNSLLHKQQTESKAGAETQDEPRDQGLTRPKVRCSPTVTQKLCDCVWLHVSTLHLIFTYAFLFYYSCQYGIIMRNIMYYECKSRVASVNHSVLQVIS